MDYVDRPYTLDEIRYSLPLREHMPRVDLDTVTFDAGSWDVGFRQSEAANLAGAYAVAAIPVPAG